ncbi:hypothetical protein M8818_001266 [Zalaria obscura]|uniref:Uncharacterized protein n=1 Tax=Zalaria obscura TaxID=2024903 RepID=A0ACC3SNU1_9PEZI
MSSSAVTQKNQGQVAKQQHEPKQAAAYESKEASASANASAGLNLNIFGAISGAFSGKSKKQQQPDGSSVENREERSHVQGAGAGRLDAAGAANAEARSREERAKIMEK